MSRSALSCGRPGIGFPRVSGDEPMNELDELRSQVFSPRERG